ncbi:MAG: tetratricopeptide repeat protein [Flavobacteriales bacterium]
MTRNLLLAFFALPLLSIAQGTANDHYLNAQAAYSSGNWTTAHALADSAIAADATFAKAWKLRGDCKQKLKDPKASLEDYSQAIKLDKSDARAYVSRSAARITLGNHNGALGDLDKAIELTPDDADILYNRACAKYMGGDNNGALRDAQRAMKLNEGMADALFLSGVIKGEEQRTEEGLLEVEAALKMKQDIPGGAMALALLYYDQGEWDQAIARLDDVIARADTGAAEAHYYRGDCYYNLKNKEKACEDWTISASLGDKEAKFIQKNYCLTDEEKIPKKPKKGRKKSVIEF